MLRVLRVLLIDGLILVAWLASVGLVLFHERGHLGGGAVKALRTLHASLNADEQWFGLYYQGQKIGFAQTILSPEEREGIPGLAIADQGHLGFTLLGVPQRVTVTARAFIDADWRLRQFSATLSTESYALTWTGIREGEHLVMTVVSGEGRYSTRLRDPGGSAFVVGLSPWSAFHRLKVGQWGTLWMLNPLALKPEPVSFHVRREESLTGERALVIESEIRGMTMTSWVTPEGKVLKEESPLGWELVRESRQQAMAGLTETTALDLLSALAVPIDRPFAHPERLRRAVLLVHGIRGEDLVPDRPWQRVLPPARLASYQREPPQGAWCVVELKPPSLPAPSSEPSPSVERYRRPSPFVQSDHPRVQAQARAIVGAATDPWQQAIALQAWVHASLAKRLTVGLPSAIDVLASKSGDCHEHTVLFTALARSLGMPTRMIAGLVSYGGRLFYHAWPEVWLGGWIPVDPTLGQALADATHLGLIEAENEQLVGLGAFVGHLKVEVLEADEQ